jgi:hypothetical protein
MIKLRDILLEMGAETIKPIMDLYDQNPDRVSRALFPGAKTKSKDEVEKELRGFDYNEFSEFRDELGVEIEESKEKPGLWANIRAQRARGEKPARKGTKAFKQAVKAADDINSMDELSLKKMLGTTALAAGLAMSPNQAKAQEPNKAPTTQVQQQDTAQTATATYAHPNENTARSVATTKARAALATKLGKPEGSISTSTADTKMYKLADGRYECTATVKIN